MASDDLILYKKAEEFLKRIYPRLKNYPKSEKFDLCSEIRKDIYALLRYIHLANSVKSKRLENLQFADGHLQTLKTLIKLSKWNKYISKGFYEEIDLLLTEINKLLSGYIKSTVRKK